MGGGEIHQPVYPVEKWTKAISFHDAPSIFSCGSPHSTFRLNQPPPAPPASPLTNALVTKDQPSRYYTAARNEVAARFTFKVKNTAASDYVIEDVRTSCECTIAGMPDRPWILTPGETNKLEAVVDLRDYMKDVTTSQVLLKEILVISTNGTSTLTMAITIPPGLTNTLGKEEMDRIWGQKLAAVDHQAVFQNQCAVCHLVPAYGKTGGSLYATACGICHDDAHRAPMVPDLHALKAPIGTNYWRNWITYGKAGTLMPGFINNEGGPLEAAQIDSLLAYVTNAFPRPIIAATNTITR